MVAPHAGAWIETLDTLFASEAFLDVAPHAGAWIETSRGKDCHHLHCVAPHAGAWIETPADCITLSQSTGRAPRGRVD